MVDHMEPIAILGAGGGTGRPLVAELERRGVPVRAIVRRREQAGAFKNARIADLQNVDQLVEAVAGSRAIHLIPPVFNDKEGLFAANAISAAQKAGIARFTYHSVLHAPTPAMPHHLRKSQVELMLRESPLIWTILQPAMYVQTCFTFLDQSAEAFTPPFRLDSLFNPIDLPDLTEAAANILTSDGHEFATYELAGAERLTPIDMTQILRTRIGGDIVARQVPAEAFARSRAKQRGFDVRQTEELLAMYSHYDGFGLPGNCNVLEMVLGRKAGRFAAAITREFKLDNAGKAATAGERV